MRSHLGKTPCVPSHPTAVRPRSWLSVRTCSGSAAQIASRTRRLSGCTGRVASSNRRRPCETFTAAPLRTGMLRPRPSSPTDPRDCRVYAVRWTISERLRCCRRRFRVCSVRAVMTTGGTAMDPAVSSTAPTVSVVIPVKDDAPLLAVCLRALMPQLNAGDEVIVVDNGCIDDSAAVAQRAGARVVVEQRPGHPGGECGRVRRGSRRDRRTDGRRQRARAELARQRAGGVPRRYRRSPRSPEGHTSSTGRECCDCPACCSTSAPTFCSSVGPSGTCRCSVRTVRSGATEWLRVRDAVHRTDAELHDDIDLSFHLGPLGRIRFLRGLRMGISSRPLYESRQASVRRMRRAFRSLGIHWPEQRPSVRYAARLTAAGIIRPPARLRSHRN